MLNQKIESMRPFLSLIFILWGLSAISQDQPQPAINWEMQALVRCGSAGNVSVLTDRADFAGRVRFELLDAKNEVINVEELDLRKLQITGQYEGAFFWNGKFTVLTSLYYPGPQRNHLILRQYSLPDFQEVRSEIIDEAYTPDRFRIPFGYSLSPDSSKVVFYSWSYALKEGSARIVTKVMDRELKLLWQEKYILPYDNRKLYVHRCMLDDAGQAYLVCEYYEGKLNPDGTINQDKIKHFLLRLEKQSNNMRQYALNLDDQSISYPTFKMDKKGNVYGTAFIKKRSRSKVEGLVLVDIDAGSGDLHRNIIPLSEQTYDLAYANGEKEKFFNPQKHSFRYFEPDFIHFNTDGSLVVVAEQRPIIDDYRDPLENNDILALKISNKRQMDWMARIPKRQNAYDENGLAFLGYGMHAINDTIMIFYNDERHNYEKERGTAVLHTFEPYNLKEPVAVMITLYPDGHFIETLLLPTKDSPKTMYMIPQKVWKKSAREVLLYCEMASGAKVFGFLYPFRPLGR